MKKSVILMDGGMGQELIRRSGRAPTPLWSARVLLDNPQLVEDLHIDFIKAGAKFITLNNYTATPARLARDASPDLFTPIHEAAKKVALSARDKSGYDDVKIAGCLPPLLASYKPELVPSEADCLAQYRELVAAQMGGVDLFICETLATIREAFNAAKAVKETGLPVIVSFTLDDDNPAAIRSGESLMEAARALEPLGVAAVTVNCSMPETIKLAMPKLAKVVPMAGGYANGFQSIAALDAGGTVAGLKARKDLTPDIYADYALDWAEAGARLIGGCCEVGPAHIAAVRDELLQAGYEIAACEF